MNYKKWLYSGIAIFVGSLLVGILGTIYGVYDSFDALKRSGDEGIGVVGADIQNALIFTTAGIVGSVLGTALISVGGVKAYRGSKTVATSTTD